MDTATVMGTDNHSTAHGVGVCNANSVSRVTSRTLRTHEGAVRDRAVLAVDVTAERQ
jgi:hypothetical protein